MRVAIAIGAGILMTLLLATHAADTLELPARDLALRVLPERPAASTVVVAIDERSLRQHGPWPWSRGDLARIVDRCEAAGARAVVFDILLSDPRDGDDVLAASMRTIPTAAVSVLVEGDQWLVPAPKLRDATRVAHGNFELDHDGILRRFSATKQSGDRAYTALSIEAASFVRDTAAPVGRTIAPAFRTPPRAIPLVSAADVLSGRIATLRNKVVFVGPTALGLGDRVLTPVSSRLAPDAGVTVHAAATESLVRHETIHEIAPLTAGFLAALAVGAILLFRRLATFAAAAIAIAGGLALLATAGIAIPFVTLMLAIALTGIAAEATRMTATLRQSREDRAHDLDSKRLLAHELKTPVASMRNLTQLLADFELSDAERRRVAVLLQSEAGKLETMVQALLDLERLPLRDFRAASRVTDLGELVKERVDVLRASAGRALNASIEPNVLVRADGMLIERVIDNLVGNALKYTDTPVDVTVRGTGAEALLEVADRGPGIPADDRDRIFQRFFRGATARGTEGLGLGLSFVAEVARWHGARVSLESAREGGALFRVAFPLSREGQA
jgi:signal transduction histidine kinase